ncbi:MAG TPA: biotin/lipoyl-containing protein, partial [Steroidobacteraceae bacterium]|nr:biotin/lipoyl-containing protein [Steroidobacteraceae bacterium]
MNAAVRLAEVRVPDMGNFKDVAVIDVLVKPGDSIEPEAPLVTLETEKATMDVPSTAGGIIEKVHVEKGGKVNAGDLIATVRPGRDATQGSAAAPIDLAPAAPAAQPTAAPAAADGTMAVPPGSTAAMSSSAPSTSARGMPATAPTPPAPAASAASAAAESPLRADLPPINEPGFSRAHAGPSVRKFARELGVDLARVPGHGFKDRITQEDVKAFVKSFLASGAAPGSGAAAPAGGGALPAVPAVDFSAFGPIETQPL